MFNIAIRFLVVVTMVCALLGCKEGGGIPKISSKKLQKSDIVGKWTADNVTGFTNIVHLNAEDSGGLITGYEVKLADPKANKFVGGGYWKLREEAKKPTIIVLNAINSKGAGLVLDGEIEMPNRDQIIIKEVEERPDGTKSIISTTTLNRVK